MSDTIIYSGKKKVNVTFNSSTVVEEDLPQNRESYIKTLCENEYNRGFDDGSAQTALNLEAEYLQRLVERSEYYQNIVNSINEEIGTFEKNLSKTILELALIISEKIIGKEAERRPIISENIHDILGKITGALNITVRINPLDYAQLNENDSEYKKDFSFSKIIFEQDSNIERGGCFIQSDIGNIDARISTRLSEIRKSIDSSLIIIQ